MRLVDTAGRRLYLNAAEREAFRYAAEACLPDLRSFCLTLLYTGCRISEALALTVERVDLQDGTLTFESLKKRRRGVYRSVPVPMTLLETIAGLDTGEGVAIKDDLGHVRVWPWPRRSAYRRVKTVMSKAGVVGPQACPKGLRHGLGVACVERGIALNMIQKWLGHARLSTTAIYVNAVGEEERNLAARLWEDL